MVIGVHQKEIALLKLIKAYFGGIGFIGKAGKDSISYTVSSLVDLTKVIIPHLDKYPLITNKKADYELFKRVVEKKISKEHLSYKGVQEILNIRASMNTKVLANELIVAFPNTMPVVRPSHTYLSIPNPHWLAGFSSAECCFYVYIKSSLTGASLEFRLTQHIRDEGGGRGAAPTLMNSLISFLGCGRIVKYPFFVNFVVSVHSDIIKKIIPFFAKYQIKGIKALDFSYWSKISELITKKEHLNPEGLTSILKLKSSMNRGRLIEESSERSLAGEAAPFFMYNRDKTVLYFSGKNVKEFSKYLKIHKSTLFKHLDKDTFYLGKYVFTKKLSENVLK